MRSAIRFISCSVVVPNNRAQNSAYKNLLSTEKITTLEQRTADVARGLYFIETQGAYEIRLGHMSTWPCKSARRFANLQTSLHVCRAACLFARPHARVHASPDHFQRKLNLRDDVWVEVTSQHGLLPETHPGIF